MDDWFDSASHHFEMLDFEERWRKWIQAIVSPKGGDDCRNDLTINPCGAMVCACTGLCRPIGRKTPDVSSHR